MVLQMLSRSMSCWSMLSHRVHLEVPWICKAQTAYILRSQELGGTLKVKSKKKNIWDQENQIGLSG
jgi:hypothetical protein